MKNFSQPGDTIDVAAPSGGLVSGLGFFIGSLFGVAVATVAENLIGALVVEGVVEIAKLSTDNMTLGLKVNWNDTNDEVQLATTDLDNVGTVVVAAGASTTVVQIKLTPV